MILGELTSPALKAAMQGGTNGWGQWSSAADHVRYAEPYPKEYWRRRRNCPCGCKKRSTHTGSANGVALMSGCELRVARWVKNGR